jgi:hypothetical protein
VAIPTVGCESYLLFALTQVETIHMDGESPVPFLLIRRGVASDWMFFLDDEDWFGFWARRFGESAIRALAGELRRINWRRLGTV